MSSEVIGDAIDAFGTRRITLRIDRDVTLRLVLDVPAEPGEHNVVSFLVPSGGSSPALIFYIPLEGEPATFSPPDREVRDRLFDQIGRNHPEILEAIASLAGAIGDAQGLPPLGG
jgi:hypothetical protein